MLQAHVREQTIRGELHWVQEPVGKVHLWVKYKEQVAEKAAQAQLGVKMLEDYCWAEYKAPGTEREVGEED